MQGRTYSTLSFLLLTMAVSAPLGGAQGPKPLAKPTEKRDIYPASVDAKAEIAEALANAAKTHRRVILVFGGNWCYDCHALDAAFHSPEIEPTLNKNFVVVHVNIGEFDKNLDIADKYEVPLKKGVPASAVLESDGKLLFSQKHGEFEAARSMASEDVLVFLNKWKPEKSAN
jgi:thioredoxin-related protein